MACLRRQFPTRSQAELVAARQSLRLNIQFYAVPCNLCGKWHVGRSK